MYLHIVGFGPKHLYDVAPWDDENCYVNIRKFSELVYVLNTPPVFV